MVGLIPQVALVDLAHSIERGEWEGEAEKNTTVKMRRKLENMCPQQ